MEGLAEFCQELYHESQGAIGFSSTFAPLHVDFLSKAR